MKFKTKKEAYKYFRRHMPIMIPAKHQNAKYPMVSPFISNYAFEYVCNYLAELVIKRDK